MCLDAANENELKMKMKMNMKENIQKSTAEASRESQSSSMRSASTGTATTTSRVSPPEYEHEREDNSENPTIASVSASASDPHCVDERIKKVKRKSKSADIESHGNVSVSGCNVTTTSTTCSSISNSNDNEIQMRHKNSISIDHDDHHDDNDNDENENENDNENNNPKVADRIIINENQNLQHLQHQDRLGEPQESPIGLSDGLSDELNNADKMYLSIQQQQQQEHQEHHIPNQHQSHQTQDYANFQFDLAGFPPLHAAYQHALGQQQPQPYEYNPHHTHSHPHPHSHPHSHPHPHAQQHDELITQQQFLPHFAALGVGVSVSATNGPIPGTYDYEYDYDQAMNHAHQHAYHFPHPHSEMNVNVNFGGSPDNGPRAINIGLSADERNLSSNSLASTHRSHNPLGGGGGDNNNNNHHNPNDGTGGGGTEDHDLDINADLLTLVQSYDWPSTLARISSHPSEATSVGIQGRTPLHVACDHDAPAVVVDALLHANPIACTMVGTSDMNPLHITCSCQRASVEVVKVLLKDVPLNGYEYSNANAEDLVANNLHVTDDNGDDDDSASINTRSSNGNENENGNQTNGNGSVSNDAKNLNNASENASSASPEKLSSNSNINSKPLTSTMVTTSMKDVDGDTPLHAACRCGAPIEVLKVLLQANPAVVHDRDYEGLTPLLRLWVRYFVTLGDDVINEVSDREDVATKGNGTLAEAWKKTELLLRAAYYGSVEEPTNTSTLTIQVAEIDGRSGADQADQKPSDDQTEKDNLHPTTTTSLEQDLRFLAIHAASSVDCPRAVVKIATVLYPHQLEEFDSSFRTPLMIAASTPIYKEHDLSGEGYSLEELIHGEDEDGEYYDEGGSEGGESTDNSHSHPTEQKQKQPTVLQILLDAGANARNGHDNFHQGRIPLHQTILSGKRWHEGVKVMRNAYPDGLIKADKETGLFAFMLAATLGKGKRKLKEDILSVENRKDLNTIFELLRSRPEALCVRK